jgi:hypothetical protein
MGSGQAGKFELESAVVPASWPAAERTEETLFCTLALANRCKYSHRATGQPC